MRLKGKETAYGRAAVELLARQVVAAKAGEPLAPVTVVVASNAASVAARRWLAAQPAGVANVSFLTLHRLAERLAGPALAAAGRRPVSMPVLTAAVRAVLHDEPGVFAPVAGHPATEQALVGAHRELRSTVADQLTDLAGCSRRAAEVVRVHLAVQDRLADAWFDEHDLLLAAAELLADGRAPVEPIIVHLLTDLSDAGARLVRALRPSYVNVGVTGDVDADRAVIEAHARAGVDLPTPTVVPTRAGLAVSASDPDDEVRGAVRQLTAWVHEGRSLGRIAVLYPLADPYARLLQEQLGAAGIPWHGTPVRRIGALRLGRTLRALLALPDRDFRRSDVLAVLGSRAWEVVSREAGVIGGADWADRLATFAASHRLEAEAYEQDDPDDWRIGRLRRDADQADELAAAVARLRTELTAGAVLRSWQALADFAAALLDHHAGDERRRQHWPDGELAAARRVEAAIERLGDLDAIEGPAPDLEVFRRALDAELDAALPQVGRMGEGVLVGPVSAAAGLVLDRVIVLGLAEGVFPPRRLEDSLLPDAERAVTAGALALRADRVHDDHRNLLVALASADEAVLFRPRGDLRRSGERPPSRWAEADDAAEVPSYVGGLLRVAAPSAEQELRLASIARGHHDHPALDDVTLRAATDVVLARRSATFTRFDGNLAAVVTAAVVPERASATRLQTWASCPHRYLLQYLLGVDPVEQPAAALTITPIDQGNLIHEVLDTFVAEAIRDGHPLDDWTVADEARVLTIAEAAFSRYEQEGRTGRPLLWRRDRGRILRDLEEFLRVDGERLRQGYRPLHTELRFEDLAVHLPGGRQLLVRGAIDRIDRAPDGSLVVLDYKTGSDASYTDLSAETPHANGKHLQLYLYALAARRALPTEQPVHAAYWFNTSKRGFKQRGYPVTPEIEAEVAGAIATIVAGIAGGLFPARTPEPTSFATWVDCDYCRPDGLSGAERRREWERKRLDPTLRAFVTLVEPEALVAHD